MKTSRSRNLLLTIYKLLASLKNKVIVLSCYLKLRYIFKIKTIGHGVTYTRGFKIYSGNENISLGNNVSLSDVLINAGSTQDGAVVIGNNAFFGHKCMLLARTHDYRLFGNARIRCITEKKIDIKQGAWIASGAIILGGVTIGSNAVVAAGAVVSKNVPSSTIFGGIPAIRISKIHN